jgi:hypothetical protein
VPSGFVDNTADCDDGDPDVHPDATEVCNGIDDDCDADVDEDSDGDGFTVCDDCNDTIFDLYERASCRGESEDNPADSCAQIQDVGHFTHNDIYWLQPEGLSPFEVWCDLNRLGGGWYLVTTWQDVGGSIVDDDNYDPVVPGIYVTEDPLTMSGDEHGHLDLEYEFTELMVSDCEPDQWYIRFIVSDNFLWSDPYRDYLEGIAPSTGWGDLPGMSVPEAAVQIYAKAPDGDEQNQGIGTEPICMADANTSDEHSPSHRIAWNIYPRSGGEGYLHSYYMLSEPVHSMQNIPYGFSRDSTNKMCVWVR